MDAPLTRLEQKDIKAVLKEYLRVQSDFTDFDYEGSNLNILLDLLAYNSKITSYNINLVANEGALETATFRDNVVKRAKALGYNPKSYTSSKVNLKVTVNTETNYEKIEIAKGSVLSAINNNNVYLFNTEKKLKGLFNGTVVFYIEAAEGKYLKNSFTVSDFTRFIIPNNFVDIGTVKVSVYEEGEEVRYSRIASIDNITSNDRIFFIEEIDDQKYEIIFGDGVIGRRLQNNELVVIEYLVTSGKSANNIKNFSFTGTVTGIYADGSRENISDGVTVEILSTQSTGGSDFETINSIKFNAPRFYASQNRAVTANDYESIIKKNFPSIENIKVVSGDELNPPKYGKVYIYLSLENRALDDFTKEEIRRLLKDLSLSGFKIEFLDPDFTTILLFTKVLYDRRLNNKTEEELRVIVSDVISAYKDLITVKSFGGRYVNSQLISSITRSDESLVSVDIEPVMLKTVCFEVGKASYNIDFKNPIGGCLISNLIYVDRGLYIKNYQNKVFLGDDGAGRITISAYKNKVLTVIGYVGTIDYSSGTINLNIEPEEDICLDIYALPEDKNINALGDTVLVVKDGDIDVEPSDNPTDLVIDLPEVEPPSTENGDLDETDLTLDDFGPEPKVADRCF